jgi:hypothetical protein
MTSTDEARKTFITTYQIFCPIYCREVDLASLVPTLDATGDNFLNKVMHHSNPAHRITAQEALENQFFFDMVGHVCNRDKFTNRPEYKTCMLDL